MNPDGQWGDFGGTSDPPGGVISIPKKTPPNPNYTRLSIAHEVGHETKYQFKRANFGNGDHSSTNGLMDKWGSDNKFNNDEIKILRGVTP
jgi:hypothetical protein